MSEKYVVLTGVQGGVSPPNSVQHTSSTLHGLQSYVDVLLRGDGGLWWRRGGDVCLQATLHLFEQLSILLARLRRYASPTVSVLILLVVGIGWLTSMSIIALVPIDVYTTLSSRRDHSISLLWSVSYWTTQALTWLVIPLLQGYADAGDFTVVSRLRTSIRENLTFYAVMGAAGLIGLTAILIAGKMQLATVLGYCIALSNTFGLVAITLFLGYGLVELPRSTWRQALPEARLRWHCHRLGKVADKQEEAVYELQNCLTVVQRTWESMSSLDPLRPYMSIIYQYAEQNSPLSPAAVAGRQQAAMNGLADPAKMVQPAVDVRALARLRKRLRRTIAGYNAARSEYVVEVSSGMRVDSVCKARQSGDYKPPVGTSQTAWVYECVIKPWLLKTSSLMLAAVSAAVVWAEGTIAIARMDLSPFSLAIHAGSHGEVRTQVLVMLPLIYMCACAYLSLFKLGAFSFYSLVPHYTDAFSLLLNASLLARFAAPLCFNFLHLIRMHHRGPQSMETVFAEKMGAMQEIPFFGKDFNSWFPLVVVVYCLALFLNLWDKLAGLFCPQRFRFGVETADDEHTDHGKQLLRREQEGRQRGMAIGECLHLLGNVEAAPGWDPTSSMRNALRDYVSTTSSTGDKPLSTLDFLKTSLLGRPASVDSLLSESPSKHVNSNGVLQGLNDLLSRVGVGGSEAGSRAGSGRIDDLLPDEPDGVSADSTRSAWRRGRSACASGLTRF